MECSSGRPGSASSFSKFDVIPPIKSPDASDQPLNTTFDFEEESDRQLTLPVVDDLLDMAKSSEPAPKDEPLVPLSSLPENTPLITLASSQPNVEQFFEPISSDPGSNQLAEPILSGAAGQSDEPVSSTEGGFGLTSTPMPPAALSGQVAVPFASEMEVLTKESQVPEQKEMTEGDNKFKSQDDLSLDKTKVKKNKKKMPPEIDLSETATEEVLSEVARRLDVLNSYEDSSVFAVNTTSEDLAYIRAASRHGERGPKRVSVYDCYEAHYASHLFRRIWSNNFPLDFLKKGSAKEPFLHMKDIMIVLWNGTDMGQKLVNQVMEIKLYEDIFGFFTGGKFSPEAITNPFMRYLMKGCMGILNNCLQKYDSREIFRQCNAVEIFLAYKDAEDEMVACKSLMILSYLINEEENEKLNSDDKFFKFFMKLLADSLKSDDHHSKRYGYSSYEILESLNRLASNDTNKESIMSNGALDYYVQLMDPNTSSPKENATAARGIWTLAFKCCEDIKNHPGCLKALVKLSLSDDDNVKKQAKGALWTLAQHGVHPQVDIDDLFDGVRLGGMGGGAPESNVHARFFAPPPPPAPGNMEPISTKGASFGASQPIPSAGEYPSKPESDVSQVNHVFISYNWGSKPMMLQVSERLKKEGYKVWMDVEDMSGSILEAMAVAVEQAAVVLVCFSQKYKESPNCRLEAEYTFTKRKSFIPLRLEYRYKPDGWLGALLGSQLFFDFSREEKFESSIKGLVRELGNKGRIKPLDEIDAPAIAVTPEASPNVLAIPPTAGPPSVSTWSHEDVHKWLDEIKLNQQSESLRQLDGGLLLELREMLEVAPEVFYVSLKQDFNLTIIDTLKFTKNIKELR